MQLESPVRLRRAGALRRGTAWLEDRFLSATTVGTLCWVIPAVAAPAAVLLAYSFITQDYVTGRFSTGWTLENWRELNDPLIIDALKKSLFIATTTTVACAVLGYPLAYFIARHAGRFRNMALFLVIVPFWLSFIVRAYAWLDLLADGGPVNRLLQWTGATNSPVHLVNNTFGVAVGMVYGYLPLMVFPLYSSIQRVDERVLEAARDLGATSWATFRRVTLPQSLPGLAAGCVIVWIPAVGEYVIPEILGGGKTFLIGNVVAQDFTRFTWPTGAALAVGLVLFAFCVLILGAALFGVRRLARAVGGSLG